MSIGQEGMVVAAKAIALTALDLFTDPALVQAAKDDFKKQTAGKLIHGHPNAAEAVDQLPQRLTIRRPLLSGHEFTGCGQVLFAREKFSQGLNVKFQ